MSEGILKRAGVAILFAICGAWSSQFCVDGKDRLIVTLPIPFALLSTLLFWRSIRAIFIGPAIVMVWLVAYMGAMAAGMEMGIVYRILSDYLPMVLGGLIGGFGLSLCAGVFMDAFAGGRWAAQASPEWSRRWLLALGWPLCIRS